MATNFFERQDEARTSTYWLVFYFILAVIAIIISSYFVISYSLQLGGYDFSNNQVVLFTAVTLFTILLVGGGSVFKILQLRGGGERIAERLGGKRIHYDSGDLKEKRLINVVQEMSIASGISAPPVYLLDESGINAFAAGYSPNDAVIGVTRGAAERLSRAELQGVIAHEFSHILNGDMRLNIRLIGVVHGILVLGILGYYLFYMSILSGDRHSRRNNASLPLALLGLGLLVVGYVGTFFGNLIKSAVNRQREYLADASAVQFTRNPDGLAGALMTIGGYDESSTVTNENADEVSHMFFSRAFSDFRMLFSTHPPLKERIKALKPEWEGPFPEPEEVTRQQMKRELESADAAGVSGLAGGEASGETGEDGTRSFGQDQVERIGQPEAGHLAYARRIMNELPRPLFQAIHTPYEARGIVYALLVHPNEHDREKQFRILEEQEGSTLVTRVKLFTTHLDETTEEFRLPLLELAMQELRSMSEEQTSSFLNICDKLVHADDQVELFEWCIFTSVKNVLTEADQQRSEGRQNRSIEDAKPALEDLLSHLAAVGHREEGQAINALRRARRELGVDTFGDVSLSDPSLKSLREAVDTLQHLKEKEREQVVRACVACAESDGQVTVSEGELVRAICAILQCPMPPILSEDPSNSENDQGVET